MPEVPDPDSFPTEVYVSAICAVASPVCHLLRLPPELRVIIYDLLLPPSSSTIYVTGQVKTFQRNQNEAKTNRYRPDSIPPLARTCRQLRREVLPRFFMPAFKVRMHDSDVVQRWRDIDEDIDDDGCIVDDSWMQQWIDANFEAAAFYFPRSLTITRFTERKGNVPPTTVTIITANEDRPTEVDVAVDWTPYSYWRDDRGKVAHERLVQRLKVQAARVVVEGEMGERILLKPELISLLEILEGTAWDRFVNTMWNAILNEGSTLVNMAFVIFYLLWRTFR